MLTDSTRAYFAEIGRRGGRKSRRSLTADQARQMVAVRLGRAAFKKYRTQCFWPYAEDLIITSKNLPWVADQLRRNGNLVAWKAAARIMSLMQCR